MAQAHYLTMADVRDETLKNLVTDDYLALGDRYITTLCKRRGVTVSDVTKPLPDLARELLIAYTCMSIALDKMGVGSQQAGHGVELDIYMVKEKAWRREFERLEPQVTAEVLLDEADTPGEFASSIMIFRG
jgi:hypothetical protein